MNTIELDQDLKLEIENLNTVSDRIRLLDNRGIARADIARFLGKRYQHVRNVLEQDRRKSEQPAYNQTNQGVWHLSVGKSGQLNLPQSIVDQIQLGPGREVVLTVENGELRINSVMTALRKAQALVQKLVPAGESMADELIADRRREAKKADAN
jgi:antitoxin component of MazEF toxin-antitoxin module